MEESLRNFIASPVSDQTFSQELYSLGLSLSPSFQEDIQITPNIFSNSTSLQGNQSSSPEENQKYSPKQHPFKITKTQPRQDLLQIAEKSKIIEKRNKAKQKAKAKEEVAKLIATSAKKYVPPELENPNLDAKTKRKLVQMLKNRISSQKTRDHRKAYISELEEVKYRLEEENLRLNLKNNYLEERLKAIEEAQIKLKAENEELRKRQGPEAHIDDPFKFLQLSDKQAFSERVENSKVPVDVDFDGELPVLSRRSSSGKSSFGYLFTMTTIIAVFSSFRYTEVNTGPLNKQDNNDSKISTSTSTSLVVVEPQLYLFGNILGRTEGVSTNALSSNVLNYVTFDASQTIQLLPALYRTETGMKSYMTTGKSRFFKERVRFQLYAAYEKDYIRNVTLETSLISTDSSYTEKFPDWVYQETFHCIQTMCVIRTYNIWVFS